MARKEIYAGELIETVQFREPVITKNDEGGIERTYPNDGNVILMWVAIRDVDQKRVMEAGTDSLVDSKEVFVRDSVNRSAIDKDWIMTHKGTDYIVVTKERVDNRNKFIRFIVRAKTAGIV